MQYLTNVAFTIQHIYFYGSYGLVMEEIIWDDQYTGGQAGSDKNLILDRCWCCLSVVLRFQFLIE